MIEAQQPTESRVPSNPAVVVGGAGSGSITRGNGVAGRRLVAGALAASLSLITAPGLASDLESPHAEVDDATGAAQTGYTYEGEHAHAAYDSTTGDERYYLRDAMGSVIAIVNTDASESARIHYDGFGNERRSDGPLAALPEEGAPRFQGMWREPDGLYYVRARNYDPQTGRFLSRDPAEGFRGRPSTFAAYEFAASSLYWLRDPTGRTTAVSSNISIGVNLTLSTIARESGRAVGYALVCVGVGEINGTGPCARRREQYVVVLQAQGGGVQESVRLQGASPVTVAQGVAGLVELRARLTRRQTRDREQAFAHAERWIRRLPPGGAEGISRTFSNRGVRPSDARVDVAIFVGRNFVN